MKKLVAVIAGAGSTYTPGIINALLSVNDFPVTEIRLYDISEEKNTRSYEIVKYLLEKSNVAVPVLASCDPEVAFEGADYIFCQIRPGGLEMREHDEKIPLKYGLVGQETCGLGGFSYGMRSMKGFLSLMEHITRYAPDAWILNYTNPETIIAESVRRMYPNAKIINACDMTISIEKTLADIYGYNHDNWIPTYYGLNHFGWYSSIYDIEAKRDIMPDIIKKAQEHGVWLNEGDASWKKTYSNLGKLIQMFPDAIPNNYLEYYLMSDDKANELDPNYTRANYIMDNREKHTQEFYNAIVSKDPEALKNFNVENEIHGMYIINIARSLHNGYNNRFMLIVRNEGAVPNVRPDAMVEIPVYVGKNGVNPVALQRNIPDFHKGFIEAQVASEKLLVDAYFENSYLKALQAFTLNQTVNSMHTAQKVLDEFIKVNGNLWPELK